MSDADPLLIRDAIDFLRAHPPFDAIDEPSLRTFLAKAKLGYYAQGSRIIGPESGVLGTLYIVQRGLVHGRSPATGSAPSERQLEFATGEAFPIAAVFGRRATSLEYVATHDTFTYEIDGEAVEALARASRDFERYCTRQIDGLLQRATARLQEMAAAQARTDQPMTRSLASLVRRAPVTCAPTMPLRQAVREMATHSVGAIVLVDDRNRPVGIFTERDLLRGVAERDLVLDATIETVATRRLVSLPASAAAIDAAAAMVEHGIRHVVVLDGERLVGVVSERDLFALQRHTMVDVARRIDEAGDDTALARAAEVIRGLVESLLAQGVGAESLTALISTLNDRLTRRLLTLEAARSGVQDIEFCWLALGSEGREEQTLATDQDNAIAFRSASAATLESTRQRLLDFARSANALLDRCGFPLCRGNVMASNAELCLSIEEWQGRFDQWLRLPTPEAILSSTIVFDFRSLWGDLSIGAALRVWLGERLPGASLFLRLLVEDALRTSAPIGWLGGLRTEAGAGGVETIDLKLQGARLFVDAARIYALAHGAKATNTAQRLRSVAATLAIAPAEVEATIDAFHFIQMLRLRRQREQRAAGNRIDPHTLNELERLILKEALRRARLLQQRLALDYRV